MGILTTEIKEFVKKQKLGFVATVCPDGTPNLSPKGTTTVWDDEHLVFADIHSPGTIDNLLTNPSVEINVVDVFVRKGYRFNVIKNIVLIKIEQVLPLISPVYDTGVSEDEIKNRWSDYWNFVYMKK